MKKILVLFTLMCSFMIAKSQTTDSSKSKVELKYSVFYDTPSSAESFTSQNVHPCGQFAYRLNKGKIVLGFSTDAEVNMGSAYLGTEYDFIQSDKTSWYGFFAAGTDIGDDKYFFWHAGGGMSYAISKTFSLDSNCKLLFYEKSPLIQPSLGLFVKIY